MALSRLDHVTVNCVDLDRSRAFYSQALGLSEGHRPPFDFPGAWFYLGDRPVVHLVGAPPSDRSLAPGAFDHLAFEAGDFEGTLSRLRGLGLTPAEAAVPGARLRQIFVHDPDGVKIELNFRG
ncbi:MAG TPA: VOC family protein [Caulobacteraceae bacterium]